MEAKGLDYKAAKMAQASPVVCIVGRQGSGKSTLNCMLEEQGYHVIELSDMVRKAMPPGYGISDFVNETKGRYGDMVFAKWILEEVRASKRQPIITGVKGLAEMNFLKQHLNMVVVAIDIPAQVRMERVLGSGNATAPADHPKSVEQFLRKEESEERMGMPKIIANADYVIVNDGTIEELKSKVLGIARNFGILRT